MSPTVDDSDINCAMINTVGIRQTYNDVRQTKVTILNVVQYQDH